jgi:hypothetical protein
MKSSILPRTHAPLDRRYAERVAIQYEANYTGSQGARLIPSVGSVQDISKTGCKILATTLPPAATSLNITLYLNDGRAPLCLTDATVSWIKGNVFAVRFPKLTPEERRRLQETILKHVTLPTSTNHRTAFRIVS